MHSKGLPTTSGAALRKTGRKPCLKKLKVLEK